MPSYDVNVPGMGRYRVNSPSDLTSEQVWLALQQQLGSAPAPAPQDVSKMSTQELEDAPSAPISIGDIGRSLGLGVYGSAKSVADAFGAGNTASQYLGKKVQELQANFTPEAKAEMARRQELENRAIMSGDSAQEAKAFVGGITEAPLRALAQGVGSSAIGITAGLASLAGGAPAGLALGVGTIARAALGAAQNAGEYKGNVLDEVKRAYVEKGYSPEQAEELALKAQEYSRENALEIGGSALLGALDAFTGVESGARRALSKAGRGQLSQEALDAATKALPAKAITAPSVAGAALRSAAGEAPLEGVQGGFGQLAQNLTMQREGLLEGDVTQGVLGSALRDAAVGALTGGAFTPVKLSEMRSDYNLDQSLRQRKEQQEFDAEIKAATERAAGQPQVYTLPGGYEVAAQPVGQFEAPIEHFIMEEGGTQPLVSLKTEEEVAPKIERLNEIRQQESARVLEQMDKLDAGVKKVAQEVELMEATGQANTPEYEAAKQRLELVQSQAEPQVESLVAKLESLGRPLVYMPGEPQTQTQQQFVLSKEGAPVGTFGTYQEAEQSVQEALGPEAFTQALEQQQTQGATQENMDRLKSTLRPMMDKFGLGDVGLNVVKQLENKAGGSYLKSLVSIALDEPKPIQTLRHESVHALKDLGFFTPQQWSALEGMAKSQWINKYLGSQQTEVDGKSMTRLEGYRTLAKKRGVSSEQMEQEIIEEAIADAFGDFDVNKAPPGMLSALYKKLKAFFEAMKNGFTGAGFQTAESVFGKIERGELKGKANAIRSEESAVRPSTRGGERSETERGEKFSLRDDIRSYLGSDEAASGPYKRKGIGDGGSVRVLGVQPLAQYEPNDPLKKLVGQYGFQSPTFYELGGKNAEAYQQAIQDSKDASPYGAAVYVYPVEEYADMRLFVTEDGKAGFALKGDDIVSVFSGPPHKGSANSSLQLAVQEGGRRLDAFDTILPELYNTNGFQIVGRMKWNEDYIPDGWDKTTFAPFNKGEPDVVYMAYAPTDSRTITENAGEYFSDPDELSQAQQNAVKQNADKGVVLGSLQPGASKFEGIHYGQAKTSTLKGGMYGTGIRGAERRRLGDAFDERIKNRVYFYIPKEDGSMPQSEAGLGGYVYKQKFDNILGPGPEMNKLFAKAQGDSNNFETEVIDAGYDGYAAPSMGMMVILNHNVPVNYLGTKGELNAKGGKYSLPSVERSTRSLMEGSPEGSRKELGLSNEKAKGATGMNKVRDVATALNNQTLQRFGRINKNQLTSKEVDLLAQAVSDEVAYQLTTTAKTGTGTGWYSENYPNALKKLGDRFPELKTNKHARSVFSALVAVTSNGENVSVNIKNAIRLYADLRMGKPLVPVGVRRADALTNNLAEIQDLLTQYGEGFADKLKEEITVSDMNAYLRSVGEEPDASYLKDTRIPAAAIYFGPKLGAFFANLSGSEGYLTMDLWWTRSINRMRGLLIPQATESSINSFRDLMGTPSATRDEVIAAAVPFKQKYEQYGYMTELEFLAGGKEPTKGKYPKWLAKARRETGEAFDQLMLEHKLEKMANTIYKNEFEMLKEDPFNASDRKFMYDIARKAQQNLKDQGVNLSLADIQAALWYYEKRLYAKLTGRVADDIGYEEAIIKQSGEGDGRERPSVVFPEQPDGRNEPTGKGAVPDQAGGVAAKKLSLARTNTPQFKQWFGSSTVVNRDGTPKVMYHGLAKDTTDFTRKTERGAPIFLTDDPKFASGFATDSYMQVASHPEKYLTQAQMADGEKKAIFAIRKDYRKDTLGKEMIASIRDGSPTPEAREYLQKEYVGLLPSGPQIMPLYVRAERSFDYENPSHVRRVLSELTEDAYDPADIQAGSWESIESADFQDAIQNAGFDSFYVKEQGRKNLAVYEPNQVKSATGNNGQFSRTNNDVRYSLGRVSFATPEEAKKAAKDAGLPDTTEFKRFTRQTQFVKPDGTPRVMYHGTSREFFEFEPAGLSQAIFLSDEPDNAQKYAVKDRERVREMAYRALTKDEKVAFFERVTDKAVEDGDIDQDQAADVMRKVKRAAPAYGSFGSMAENVVAELDALSPSKPNIMPLYASGMNLFDYENSDHVRGISNWVMDRTDILSTMQNPDQLVNGLPGLISQGWRKTIAGGDKADERNQKIANYIQQALRANGFDGFMVRENMAGEKSYAVYKPTQLKSATGNEGGFNGELKDIRYSLRSVRYSPERFDELHGQSMYTQSGAEKKTKGYLGFVQPMDFVEATTSPSYLKTLRKEEEPLDFSKMRSLGPVGLQMSVQPNGNWKITGHDGRHRMLALHAAGYRDIPVYIEFKSGIDDAQSIKTKSVPAEIDDAVSPNLLIAGLEPLSYANREKAAEVFMREQPVKYSLPTISAGAEKRVNDTTTVREETGRVQRLLDTFKSDNFSAYRAQFLNRYNRLSDADRAVAQQNGGLNLMASQSAEHAALMSDMSAGVTASAFGIGDRNGGVPIIKNGLTTIDHSKKGLLEILQPLAKYNDPKAYRYFQFYSAVKRGARLYAEGRERLIQPGDITFANELAQKFPEFEQVRKDWVAYNNELIKYQKDAGVLSDQDAIEYTKHYDYIPFFRQIDGERTIGPNIYQSISGVRKPKKLQGGDAPLADFLETVVRNSQAAITSGMKNIAAQRARDVGMQAGVVHKINPGSNVSELEKIKVLENGVLREYQSDDQLFVDAVKSLHMPDIPFLGLLSGPSTFLREAVTREPGFILANLMRDSLSAYATSGQKFTPVVDTVKNFGKSLARKSPGFEALLDAGVIGGYEFSENVEQSGRTVAKELAKRAGQKDALLLRPFTSVWDGLEKATTASDAATRLAIYDRVMQETGNEADAIRAAWEIMNFNRKGSSSIIRILTAAVPFLNARLQGLDVFYRAATGKMTTADPKVIQRRFLARASMMMATSFLYAAAVSGDPDYEKQEDETKDNNWIIPFIGAKIPIPFEVGTLFKTIPERIYRFWFGTDTGKDFQSALVRAFNSTIPIAPTAYIPQVFKPLLEAKMNYNLFTDREIVGQGMKDVATEFQVGPGTSNVAEFVGKTLGLSPMKVDHVVKGYTGTMGMYAIDLIDSITDQFGDSPKASKRFEQMPVLKRFLADPEARGYVTSYYKLKDEVDTVVRTVNLLEKSMKPDEYAKYLQENIGTLAFKDHVSDMEKNMKGLREMRKIIQSSPMSGDEKRDALTAIGQAESNLTSNIQTIKKAISESR